MNIFVEEIGTTPTSTASQLFVDNKPFCFVIEDGYNEPKVPGKTRIPPGRYQIIQRKRGKFYEKYKTNHKHTFAIELKGVPGFTDILIHIGNTVGDTRGCLLVNKGLNISPTGAYFGKESTDVYLALYAKINGAFERNEEIWIEIQRREVIDDNTPAG